MDTYNCAAPLSPLCLCLPSGTVCRQYSACFSLAAFSQVEILWLIKGSQVGTDYSGAGGRGSKCSANHNQTDADSDSQVGAD